MVEKDLYEVLLGNDEVSEDESEGDLDFEPEADIEDEFDIIPEDIDDSVLDELFTDEEESDE